MHTKTLLRSSVSFGVLSLFLCVLATPFEAQAGFQWVPPEQAAQVSAAPMMAPQPPVPVMMPQTAYAPAPQVIEAPAVKTPVPAPTMAPAPAPIPFKMPSFVPPAAPTAAEPASSLPPAEHEKSVQGFANNVPLSVALRQVLPVDFAYSVAQDVSLGTLVSWRGGANWRQVLKDMLTPAGLAAKEEGLMIEIAPLHPALGAMPSLAAPVASAAVAAPAPMTESVAPSSMIEGNEVSVPAAGKPVSLIAPPPAHEPTYPSMGYLKAPTSLAAAPAIAAPTEEMQVDTIDVWAVQRGDTLHDTLQKWAAKAHIDLSWQSEYDYPLQANLSFSGSFEDAVRGLLTGLQDAKPQPVGTLHKSQEVGQTVLVIQARGNNYND